MKQRNSRSYGKSKKPWQPKYCSEGNMDFTVTGWVQGITENPDAKEDYVKFLIDNPYKEGNVNSIDVTVPWDDGFPQLEEGDHVNIFGFIRSWWNDDIKRITYSFTAEQVAEVEEEKPAAKSRRTSSIDPLEGM